VQSFSSDDTVTTAPLLPPPPPPPHIDVFHPQQHQCHDHEERHERDTAESPRVFLSDDINTHRDVTANDITLDDDAFDVIPESRDDDNVAMVTQRTIVVDNGNDDDDTAGAVVARQPAGDEDVRIDDEVQPMNENENDAILIPEAMIDGSCSFTY